MLNKLATVRLLKISIHAFLMMFIIKFSFLLGADLFSLAFGDTVDKYTSNTPLIIFIIWLLFALQSNKYQKVTS